MATSTRRRSLFWPILLALIAAPFVLGFIVFVLGLSMAGVGGAAITAAKLAAPRTMAGDQVRAQGNRAIEACKLWARSRIDGELVGQVDGGSPTADRSRVTVRATRGGPAAACEVRDQAGRAVLLSARLTR